MKISPYNSLFCLLFSIGLLLQSCIKDSCAKQQQYTYYEPVFSTKTEVKSGIKSNEPTPIINPGKIFIYGRYIFLNEINKGIHVIDNGNPVTPKNISFINIPGNQDIAVAGNTLYADVFADLAILNIANPTHILVHKFIEGAFPFRPWNGFYTTDSNKVIVDYIKHDTTVTVDCTVGGGGIFFGNNVYFSSGNSGSAGSAANTSPVGRAGSMARFALLNSRLYTVSNSYLSVFDISNAISPGFIKRVGINNFTVETIFPFKNKLFIGSSNGMFIYNVNDEDNPTIEGQFAHVRACDPVIADDQYAYVTLRSGSTCGGFTNQMDVLDISNVNNPHLLKSYPLTNPHGLSKDKNLVFVCDGADGLKIFDATNPTNILLLKQFKGIDTYDVIANNNIALVVAKDGLYQYNYENVNNIKLLSKIAVGNK